MMDIPRDNKPIDNADFWRLVRSACADSITEEEHRQLDAILLADPSLLKQYVEYRILHAELEWRYRTDHAALPAIGAKDFNIQAHSNPQSSTVSIGVRIAPEESSHRKAGAVVPPFVSSEHPLLGLPDPISNGAVPEISVHRQPLDDRESKSTAPADPPEDNLRFSAPITFSFLQPAFDLFGRPASLGVTVVTAVIASIVTVLVAFALWKLPASQSGDRAAGSKPLQIETPPNYVARLTRMHDVEWAHPFTAPAVMSFLTAGQELELNEGSIEVTYKSGARVVLEGPVHFEVNSPNGLDLKSGRLAARVPEEARGFLVNTSVVEAVDLGTEFGVVADRHKRTTDLHVLTGEVDYRPKGEGLISSVSRLVAGESVRVHAAAAQGMPIIEPVSYDLRTLAQLHTFATARSPLERWREASARLRQDRSLVAHYNFQDQGAVLRNVVSDRLHGRIESSGNSVWTSGRWLGKGGLAFGEELPAQVVVEDAPELRLKPPFSIAVWLRPDSDRPTSGYQLIFGKGKEPARNFSLWQNREGRCQFSMYTEGGENHSLTSTSILPGSRWSFLVATVSETQMLLFIDGWFNVGLGRTNQSICVNDDPLEIGKSSGPNHPTSFAGVIDEVTVFRRALTTEEVESLYKLGRAL